MFFNISLCIFRRTVTKLHMPTSGNHYCSGKAINITYSECVLVALVIQHAMRMRHIVICGLSGCTIPIFPHYLINSAILRVGWGGVLPNSECVLFSLQLLSETFIILIRIQRHIIINVQRSSCKVPFILVRF